VALALLLGCAAKNHHAALLEQAGEGLQGAQPSAGDLSLSCAPPDSEVWLDGVPMGPCAAYAGRRGLTLGKRMGKVEIRKEGYNPFITFVEPDGTRAALSVTLTPSNTGGAP
jgi:hypothetical protein